MNKELINALQKLEIDGEVVFNETIEYCAQKIDAFINSHPTETTKVSTNKDKKELCDRCGEDPIHLERLCQCCYIDIHGM